MLEYLQVSSDNLLPPINANSFAVAIGVIVVFKAVMSWIAKRVFQITEPSRIHKDELEYSYYFHLALVILVMPDVHNPSTVDPLERFRSGCVDLFVRGSGNHAEHPQTRAGPP